MRKMTPAWLSNFGGQKNSLPTKPTTKVPVLGTKQQRWNKSGSYILPLLLIPNELRNQHIVFKTDKLACVFGHNNKGIKNDACTSILIKSVQHICAFLGSAAHVIHVPCRSDWASEMADNLSHETTTGFLETQMLNRHPSLQTPAVLLDWLQNPVEDWELPFKLLNHVTNI
jgi:hypothetical protein